MADPYLGEIRMVGFNFAPVGWAFCNGALLDISQNEALFNLIGITYGGDGVNLFALPNLSGRIPLHQGQGQGLSPRVLGESGGTESVTLTQQQIPAHTHLLFAATDGTRTSGAQNNRLASGEADLYSHASATPVKLAGGQIATAGGSQPHDNMQPFLAVNFIIALNGIFPSRN